MNAIKSFLTKQTTKRIANGITKQAKMPDLLFSQLIKKYESQMEKTGNYEIPNWFTIQFISREDGLFNFIGTFHEGKDYAKVDKEQFLSILRTNKVNFEKISEETYKIIRH